VSTRFLYQTPLGFAEGEWGPRGLLAFQLPRPDEHFAPASGQAPESLVQALDRYFAGVPEDFGGIALDFDGETVFHQEVWHAARAVPWGCTSSYGDLVARLGRAPGHARAVGRALGANRFHVIVPCHRFVAANGALVNFAAGLVWKRWLLQHEGGLLA